MNVLKKNSFGKLAVGLTVLLAPFLLMTAVSSAQDLDDLDSELDDLASQTAAKKSSEPSVELDIADDEEPLTDPFDGEKSTLEPLEAPASHPAKAKKASKAVKAAPVRTEPVVAPVKAEEPVASKSQNESLAPMSDEPNPAFESRLAAIYADSQPVSDEKWSGLLGSRAAESYSVQAGDTLWDLSQTLFADGFYWSKLWAENPEIQNPHQIEKGQAIRFIGGTEASPPEIRVVKEEPDQLTIQTQAAFEKEDVVPAMQEPKQDEIGSFEVKQSTKFTGTTPNRILNQAPYYQEDIEGKITQADLEAGVVIEQSEIVPRPILPPPSEERKKVMLNIPRSFREFQFKHFERSVTIQRKSKVAEKIPASVVPPFIAFEKVPEPMGEIVEVDQHEVASLGQGVIISANEPLIPGTRVYSVTPRFNLKSPVNGGVGKALEIGGVLRIGERIGDRDNLYHATVVYGVNAVRVGSLVLSGEPPRVPVTTTGRRLNSQLTIIGGSYSDSRRFFGDGASVFLDVETSGVRVGDVLAVQARRIERRSTVSDDITNSIGILKVFAVHGQVASAFVVLATEEIRPGYRTGAKFPNRLPDLRNDPPRITRAESAE